MTKLPVPVSTFLRGMAKKLKKIDTYFDDFNTEELISGYVIQPLISGSPQKSVAREELAKKLIDDTEFQNISNKALDDKGFDDFVSIYRIITNKPEAMRIGDEQFVSGLLDKDKVFPLHNYLTEGKSSMEDNSFLLKYDVPRDKIAGYLPSYEDRITRNVNKKIKEKGIGQTKISGFDTVTNPAKFTKGMLNAQDEIIADVSGIKPKVLSTEGFSNNKPMNLKSMNASVVKSIAEEEVKTPEDLEKIYSNFYFSKDGSSLRDLVKPTQDPNAQKYIDEVKEFFDINGFGALNNIDGGT